MSRKFPDSTLVLLTACALAMGSAALAQEQEQPPQEQEQAAPEPEPEQLIPRQSDGLPAGQVAAVLKARDANFVYRSSVRQMSCEQLRYSVATILRALGARQDVDVRANDCDAWMEPSTTSDTNSMDRMNTMDPFGRPSSALDRTRAYRNEPTDRTRTQSTPVRIRLMMPVEVTSEIVEEVDKDKARRELISRVQGNKNAAMDDPIFFPAERKEITLSYDTIRVEAIDCELLEQMSMTVFRELDLKVTNRSLQCDPRERSRIMPSLTVEALVPVGFQLSEQKKEKKKFEAVYK